MNKSQDSKGTTSGGSIHPLVRPHIGISSNRLNQDNPRELAFALQWSKEQSEGNILAHLVGRYTNRDAKVAATVVQWLGSNVGMSFLEEAIMREPKIATWLKRRAVR